MEHQNFILFTIFVQVRAELARNIAPNVGVHFERSVASSPRHSGVKRETLSPRVPLRVCSDKIVSSGGLLLHLDNKCATGYRDLSRGSVNNSQLAEIDAGYKGVNMRRSAVYLVHS